GQIYFLVNDKSGTVVGLSAADQRSIVGSTHRGLDEQWRLERQRSSGGAWLLRCLGSGKFLDFEGDPKAGARLIGSRVPRNWKLERVDEDTCAYHLYVPKTNLNAELAHGDPLPSAPIRLEENSLDACQVWRFDP
ncbi:hypothetical protein K488DRAFT_37086, partial [Vararia minispora EC-137]